MPYGTIKVDTVTFTNAGVDKSVTLSGLVQNPVFSGNVTVTGTLSGVTVTGTTANFTSGNFTNISGGTHTITSGVFAAGSAASPSITFTGDLNTGIYSPGADQVAISTGGSGRLFVDASGNVGVGITPTTRFHVYQAGSTQAGLVETNQSASVINFKSTGQSSGQPQVGCAASDMILNTNGAERLRITSAGLVGVGTSSPSQLLTLQQTSAGSAVDCLLLNNSSISNGTAVGISFAPNTTNDITRSAIIRGINESGGAGNATGLGFFTNANGASPTQKMTITSGGSVGVGTTSPASKLSVSDSGAVQIQATTGTVDFRIQSIDANSAAYSGTVSNHAYVLTTNNAERARIDSSGMLLVGTSSQSGGALLQVNGDRVRIATAKTPASATDTGTAGEICWDASYVSVCTATNTWKRSALSTW